MAHGKEETIPVKAILGYECKRFEISKTGSFSHFLTSLSDIFGCELAEVQYKDGENDLISLGHEEEFLVALKSLPSTGGILRVVISAKPSQGRRLKIIDCPRNSSNDNQGNVTNDFQGNTLSNPVKSSQTDVIVPNDSTLSDKKDIKNKKLTETSPVESRKTAIPNKIESASQLSKDLNFISAEVTGRIPVLAPSSECNLDSHFSSQKPVARKVRRVSSGTASTGTDKNEKKQGRGRPTQRKKKRKYRDTSSSSSDSSSSRMSSSSSSSSSESSCDESYSFYKKGDKKRVKSPSSDSVEKMFRKCEKHIAAKVTKDMEKHTKNFKEEIISSVTASILQNLDGVVLQSYVVPNGVVPVESNAVPSVKVGEGYAKRSRYQHQNVVCDHCENEIFGPRYKCGNCSDYDLCEQCEAIEGLHTPSHVFLKMHYPSMHAGRRSIGGKSRPLLHANIYEEREKEREMGDLLQRKLDSGPELNFKVMEKLEKRLRMKEAEQTRESYDMRKEGWKKMKKEVKKNKKELAKKLKHQGKIAQRNPDGSTNKMEDSLLSNGFYFDVESVPKSKKKIMIDSEVTAQVINKDACLEPKYMKDDEASKQTCSKSNQTQDENLTAALNSLQIIHGSPSISDEETVIKERSIKDIHNCSAVMTDVPSAMLSDDSDRVGSDVVVVSNGSMLFDLENDETSIGYETLKKPDLVDFLEDAAESTASEDFVVVSSYFDLSVPIDNVDIMEHRNCESCHNDHIGQGEGMFSDITFEDSSTSAANELPVDLVASVSILARKQPDIASVTTTNIMDQSIEQFSVGSSSLPICPEPIAHSNEISAEDYLTLPVVEEYASGGNEVSTMADEEEPVHQSNDISKNPKLPEVVIRQSDVIYGDEAVNETSLHEEIMNIQRDDNAAVSRKKSEPRSVTQEAAHLPPLEPNEALKNLEMVTQNEMVNSSDSIRSLSDNMQENNGDEPVLHNMTSTSEHNVTSSNSISSLLVGAMANIVDSVSETVAQALQPSKIFPQAEYHNGEEEVTLQGYSSHDLLTEGMIQLLDMGFFDRSLNKSLLKEFNYDVSRCVTELISITDGEWHQARH